MLIKDYKKMINKKYTSYLLSCILFSTFLLSCSFNNATIPQSSKIDKKLDFSKKLKNSITVTINHLPNDFNTKASTDGQAGKVLADVKSYEVFLTKNFNDPFATGANPLGDNNSIKVNSSNQTSQVISFSNIPSGGPYFAVIAAFDDFSTSSTKKNITQPDTSILSNDKRWARSSNSVTVDGNFNLTYSDNAGTITVGNLQLQNFASVNIDSIIILNNYGTQPLGGL